MARRLAYSDIPADLQKLIDELQKNGDYLVIENDRQESVACLAPLQNSTEAQRREAARKLREILDSVPPSPYPEDETYRIIDHAISAVRKEQKSQYAEN